MRIALVADAYPPMRTSGAVQLRDLAQELVRLGHQVSVIVPAVDAKRLWTVEVLEAVEVLRIKGPRTKDTGYVRRTLGEMLLPFAMMYGLRQSPLQKVRWDAVVWYSPSIFLAPLVAVLKRRCACPAYLVLRDIFPEWAVDMGLLRRGMAYRVFKCFESYQYFVANSIGVQSASNLDYLAEWAKKPGRCLEVLENWLAPASEWRCGISVSSTSLAGRTIFVYTGNMGIAQGMDIFLELAESLVDRRDIGFIFVGRGSELSRLRRRADEGDLDNVLFFDEIDPREIPGLLAQCEIGVVALDPRHKTHNVPGKFVAYVQAGLPVLARVNPGNDLVELINGEGVGRAYAGHSLDTLRALAEELVDDKLSRVEMSVRGRRLFESRYASGRAARQIVASIGRSPQS